MIPTVLGGRGVICLMGPMENLMAEGDTVPPHTPPPGEDSLLSPWGWEAPQEGSAQSSAGTPTPPALSLPLPGACLLPSRCAEGVHGEKPPGRRVWWEDARVGGALTAWGETAPGPGNSASSQLWGPWAPDTMSPWAAAPSSVPAISMVIPGTQRAALRGPSPQPSPGRRHPPPPGRTHGRRWPSPAPGGWASAAW